MRLAFVSHPPRPGGAERCRDVIVVLAPARGGRGRARTTSTPARCADACEAVVLA